MTLAAVGGGAVLLLVLASKSKKAEAAAAPGAPQLPDANDPHTQYQTELDERMQSQAAARAAAAAAAAAADPHNQYQAQFDHQLSGGPVSPELDMSTMAESIPSGSGMGGGMPSIPLQPVTAASSARAQPLRTFDIPAPNQPPITVRAEAANVVSKPAAVPTAAKRSDKTAATELLAYVTPILKAKRGSELGTKGVPNSFVKAAQVDMGVAPDGIYGPETRTKGKQLLGVTFPARGV